MDQVTAGQPQDESTNKLVIRATLVEQKELRYTPAGYAVFEGNFHYSGEVYEAEALRKVQMEFTALSFSNTALRLSKLKNGDTITMTGFLATRSMRSTRLTVHITEFKI